jgi:ribulose-5-phosphate 4-epimerase/fuculose-1-phosphate aldolase
MAEVFVGVKFQTVFAGRCPPFDSRLDELVQWCHTLARWGVVGHTVGNLSFRTANGYIISRTAANLATIVDEEFVDVVEADVEGRRLIVIGAYEPSSESMMHATIYQARNEVMAVFHGHSDKLLAAAPRLHIPVTEREQPYGTPQLSEEISKMLAWHNLFIMRDHGFVSLGRTMNEAARWIEQALTRL